MVLTAQCVAGARKLRGASAVQRGAKSLVNTFPFNAKDEHHEHHDHHATHEQSQSLNARLARQGEEGGAPDFGAVAEAGEKCIDQSRDG